MLSRTDGFAGDSGSANFKQFSALVKTEKQAVTTALKDLVGEGLNIKSSL
jgi:hypothetical protein